MIDLVGIVNNAVNVAFDVAGQIVDNGVYHSVVAGSYDPSTAVSVNTNTSTNVGVLFGMFEQREVDGQIVQWGDKKIIIKTDELATEPQRDDYYVAADSTRWDLHVIGIEPTRNVWILRGRAHRS